MASLKVSRLYQIKYTPPTSQETADKVVDLLTKAGVACKQDNDRGLDHGTWNPLVVWYQYFFILSNLLRLPEQDVPVVQLSLVKGLDPIEHLKIGEALRPLLNEEGLLVDSPCVCFLTNRLSGAVQHHIIFKLVGKALPNSNGRMSLRSGFRLLFKRKKGRGMMISPIGGKGFV
jgi:aromatic ring-opening dioxygenase catalytic subunit (LigB family)